MTLITIPGKTINELIQHWASRSDWSLPAFVSVSSRDGLCSINRKEVLELAGRFAHKLSRLGVKKGTIVCSTLPNSIERVVCDFGIYLAGATSMNGQVFRSNGQDFINSLRISKAQYVVVDPSIGKVPFEILSREGLEVKEHCTKCDSLPDLCHVIFCVRDNQDPSKDFISSLRNPQLSQLNVVVEPTDVASIMNTSGSTGYSKLVKHTHANICHFCVQVKAIEPLKVGDHFLNSAPLGWAGGFPQWFLGCGVTRYFLDMFNGPPTNLPSTVWQTITREKIVYAFLSPMYVTDILQNSPLWLNSDWKPEVLCLAGQPIKRGHLDIIGKLCNAIDINYGMTECNLVATHRITNPDSFADGCAGYPGNGVTIKIVDQERNVLPQGSTGEILLKSTSLTVGYLNNDEANHNTFTSDGWLCTDDAGYIDSTGKVFVEGRQSDSIMRGAYILYPSWLEMEIKKIEKVKDVVVVAVPDPILHHEICACVIPDLSTKSRVCLSSKDSSSGTSLSFIEREYEKKYKDNKNNERGIVSDVSYPPTSGHFDEIRLHGMRQSLNINYNLTQVKKGKVSQMPGTSKINGAKMIENSKDSSFETLEMEIHKVCQQSQILGEKDSMTMVPKYYLFWEQFPVTETGKLNRKEIRVQASSALGLE